MAGVAPNKGFSIILKNVKPEVKIKLTLERSCTFHLPMMQPHPLEMVSD